MREAHIHCLARRYMIGDLGLHLVEGQVVVVSEQEAKASSDLEHAKQIGAVAVVFVKRARNVRVKKEKRKKPLQVWDGSRPDKSNLPPPPPGGKVAEAKMNRRKKRTPRRTTRPRKTQESKDA